MSLKFGIYLVEQRIVSPEQFCGLVKIQQEALTSLATVAIRKNMLTIKQVARILDMQEVTPEKSFTHLAIENDFLDRADADQLLHEQNQTCPSIRKLVVECGLLTERQSQVLFQHFEKVGTRKSIADPKPQAAPSQPTEIRHPAQIRRPARPITQPETQPVTVAHTPATNASTARTPIRQPKYKQRPVIVHPFTHVDD